jgi:RNA polymerase sigma-70 factor, ECF subfamily
VGRGEGGVADAVVQVAVMAPGSEPADILLRAARRGDPDAFMKLLAPERSRLESLAYQLLDDGGDVADVVQEVYLSAYRALPKYRGDSRLATWLYRITYNACLRHQTRRPETADAEADQGRPSPDHAASVAERLDLAAALAELPIEQRALVLMVDRDGFGYRAAAEALSIPLGTVSSRLAAARAKLRAVLCPDQKGAPYEAGQ